ncbi:U3 small nucleolar RNA-associated protein [Colletotrichum graminicola]|uniref:U3 small nucleolar RNA-associated protein n=1 Tax=Colletotrichum graminicola (strain M1.001 / M2 / FGSC 10212) TaxID=645133 RepID=E3QJ08_COLGM|nr:U3 small nucleolar RNA-associated protein [Colletotrichum graminicola M1.001]EFQ30846.1 U3 small nucleolar RNA-associated protein [Colletotrichum graminicola M1.001]WDK21624.1 U3 small nucleolar RNA-associated protein [Colletotrichum graminicola]
MDLHRCRFVPYPPSAINALAFSHPVARSKNQAALSRLAVGRANGDVEIWNPLAGAWHQETVLRSGADRSVDGLVWVNEPEDDRARLFSIGYTSAVTEWDLAAGRPLRHASGQHGDIWCLAAQPPASPQDPVTRLVAGTIDGMLALYSLEDGDLRFQRLLVKSPTRKAQMVSIAFQSRHVVVVGCSDSTLRAYDMRNGSMLRKMGLGADLAGGAKDIIVWSVKVLPSGDIVSADSTGQVCIWDGKTYTQMQRIQSHRQDVLSLAISADGSAILSGGMDRRTVLYKKTSGSGARWGKVWSRKYHDHDVKAMASFESSKMSVVVSGGPDASPVVLPLKELGRENHRTLSSLPHSPPLASAPSARMVVSWWDREIHIWKLQSSFDGLYDGNAADLDKNRKLLKTILVKGESNITSAAINHDGSFLVAATGTDVKAFHLQHQDPTRPSDVKLASVAVPKPLAAHGAAKVVLSPDGAWLAAVQDGSKVLVAKVARDGDNGTTVTIQKPRIVNRLRRNIPKNQALGGLGNYERSITQLAFSPDGRMLASADLAGYIDTWVLQSAEDGANADDKAASASDSEDDDDSSKGDDAATPADERWVRNPRAALLPKLPACPVVLSFSDETTTTTDAAATEYTLVAVTTAWHILAFHPTAGSLTSWSRRNPVSRLPATIRDTRDLAKGLLWQGPRVWIYGVSFLFMLDLSQDLAAPTGATTDPETAVVPQQQQQQQRQAGTKRKRKGPESGAGARMAIGAIAPHQVDRFVGSKASKEWQDDIEKKLARDEDAMEVDDSADDDDDDDNDDGSESEGGELAALRNRNQETQTEEGAEGKTRWWYTYKYRPILGIAPLSSGPAAAVVDDAGSKTPSLEAVLVERPIWEVDLPERYVGANE